MARVIPIAQAGHSRLNGTQEFRSQPPLSLYIHIPWCVQKCPYCDFNSHEAHGRIPENEYVAALIADLESALPLIWGRRVSTFFIGGGTPSLLGGQALDTLLTAIRSRVVLLPDAEITLEANPGTAEAERFAAYREAGVNRLSLGIQSFNPRHLKALGRIHDEHEAKAAIALAARHFERFNLDLMYGLPGQTMAEALSDLETAIAFAPRHLSCYQLTLEPNTRFAAEPPRLPESDLCADMQEAIESRLASAGYLHYETSAFAQPGYQCQHNLNYWLFGDYRGIAPGAHGKLSFPDRIVRQVRWREPRTYMDQALSGHACSNESDVPLKARPFEYMLNALRLPGGFELSRFMERTGLTVAAIQQALSKAESMQLIERDLHRVWPTPLGLDFLSDLQGLFLSD